MIDCVKSMEKMTNQPSIFSHKSSNGITNWNGETEMEDVMKELTMVMIAIAAAAMIIGALIGGTECMACNSDYGYGVVYWLHSRIVMAAAGL